MPRPVYWLLTRYAGEGIGAALAEPTAGGGLGMDAGAIMLAQAGAAQAKMVTGVAAKTTRRWGLLGRESIPGASSRDTKSQLTESSRAAEGAQAELSLRKRCAEGPRRAGGFLLPPRPAGRIMSPSLP